MTSVMIVPLMQLVLSVVMLLYATIIRKLDWLFCSIATLDMVGFFCVIAQFYKIEPKDTFHIWILFGTEIISCIMLAISATIVRESDDS